MPNHVTTILTVSGNDAQKQAMFEAIKNDKVGKKEYEGGVETFSHIPDGGSKEALEMAAEVHGVDLADEGYLFNEATGQYEYHNPEEAPAMCLQ